MILQFDSNCSLVVMEGVDWFVGDRFDNSNKKKNILCVPSKECLCPMSVRQRCTCEHMNIYPIHIYDVIGEYIIIPIACVCLLLN